MIEDIATRKRAILASITAENQKLRGFDQNGRRLPEPTKPEAAAEVEAAAPPAPRPPANLGQGNRGGHIPEETRELSFSEKNAATFAAARNGRSYAQELEARGWDQRGPSLPPMPT